MTSKPPRFTSTNDQTVYTPVVVTLTAGGNDGSFIPITLAAPLLLIYVRFKGTRYLFVILEAVLA